MELPDPVKFSVRRGGSSAKKQHPFESIERRMVNAWMKVGSGQVGAYCAPSPLLEQLSAAPSETSAQPHLASPQPGAAAARPRYLASAEGGGKKEEGAAQAAPSGRSCTKEAMRPCKLHVAGSKPAVSTSCYGPTARISDCLSEGPGSTPGSSSRALSSMAEQHVSNVQTSVRLAQGPYLPR